MTGEFRKRDTERSRTLRREASPAERTLWRHLNAGQLDGCRFTKQFQIGPYFADFACRSKRLVVEIDGFSHDLRQDYDLVRDRFIQDQGYRVLRFSNADVFGNVEGVVSMISVVLADTPSPNPSRKREGGN